MVSHKQLGLSWICQRLAQFWAIQGWYSQIWNQPAFFLKFSHIIKTKSTNGKVFSNFNKFAVNTNNIKEIMKINNTNLHHKISIYHKVAKRNMCYSSWNYLKGVLQIKFSEVACDLVGNFTLNIPWFTKNNIIDRCLDFQSGLLYLFSFSTKLFSISWFKNSYHTWLKKHLLHCFPVLWKIWKHH